MAAFARPPPSQRRPHSVALEGGESFPADAAQWELYHAVEQALQVGGDPCSGEDSEMEQSLYLRG